MSRKKKKSSLHKNLRHWLTLNRWFFSVRRNHKKLYSLAGKLRKYITAKIRRNYG